MNIPKTKLPVFFVFMLLVSSAYAQDFSLFSGKYYDLKDGQQSIPFEFYNETYAICENDAKTIPILAANNDDQSGNKLALDAAGAEWAALNVREFSLSKRQSGVVFLEIAPGANTRGKYAVYVSGSSIGNVRRDLRLDIEVEKCHSLKLEFQESDKSCGGSKRKYIGELFNDGKQKIEAELNLSAPNWAALDEIFFSIAPGSREQFEVEADIPVNAEGLFMVIISAAAKNSPSAKSEKSLGIEVVPKHKCYNADIMADKAIKSHYSNEYFPIRIRNIGIKPANYEIRLEAPGWIAIEPRKLEVNPGDIGNLNLNINPGPEVQEGSYPIKINVKFEDISYSKDIRVDLSSQQLSKKFKYFFVFYQYYIYVALFIAIILFIFRRQIINKVKTSYKTYRLRQARLKALQEARKARQLKRQIKRLEKAQLEVKKISKFRSKHILLSIVLIIVISILFFSIYQFDFPVSKEFVKKYYLYFIVGILISFFIIFIIEFYKPLFRLLGKYK